MSIYGLYYDVNRENLIKSAIPASKEPVYSKIKAVHPDIAKQYTALFGSNECNVYLRKLLIYGGAEYQAEPLEMWAINALQELIELNAEASRKKGITVESDKVATDAWSTMSKII